MTIIKKNENIFYLSNFVYFTYIYANVFCKQKFVFTENASKRDTQHNQNFIKI